MKLLEIFKIDTWWKVVLLIGCLLVAVSLIFNITILNPKHLFGLGLGMFLIGIANFMAQKFRAIPVIGGYLSKMEMHHNFVSIIILIIGIGLVGAFLFMILKGLL